ncbi:Calcium-binding EF-hand family protein [Striga hermonthica]|uniref:Calcium-binding EF-hand family protein n=1 Tax=Striga hermonthica TaxID=68872 RepID=A0A9N7N1Q3_STRHE|nr:Calcium-binding EF-hand family protein [Striga hermonthica]
MAKIQYQKLPEDDKSHLVEAFAQLDRDGLGRIDPLRLLKNVAFPELVGRDLLYINQFADDSYGRLSFDRFLAVWYAGDRCLRNCHWCGKILPAVYFTCRKCDEEDQEFRLCVGCFEGGEYYHKHPAEEIEDITVFKPIESKRSPRAEDDYPVGSRIRQTYLSKELKAISEYRSRTGTNFAVMTGEIGSFLEMLANFPPVVYDKDQEEDTEVNREENATTEEDGEENATTEENREENATTEENREEHATDDKEKKDTKREEDTGKDREEDATGEAEDNNVDEKEGAAAKGN